MVKHYTSYFFIFFKKKLDFFKYLCYTIFVKHFRIINLQKNGIILNVIANNIKITKINFKKGGLSNEKLN